MTGQDTYRIRPPEGQNRIQTNYEFLMKIFFRKIREESMTFTKSEQSDEDSLVSIFKLDDMEEDAYLLLAGDDFVALASPLHSTAYIETLSSAGDERTANQDTADAMLALQWALLDLLDNEVRLIINTETLMVPRSGNLTSELDKVRTDERLKEIVVLWSPLLLQEASSSHHFSGRDRLALAAVRFMDIVYSMRKRGLAPVKTFNSEDGLAEALQALELDHE